MHIVDWILVVSLNGAIIVYGFYLSRNVHTSADWFLAGRRLPWWLVGISMYATAIDTSDLIADSGASYSLGFSFLVLNWVGVVAGWALAAFFVCLPMYRAGMYTNAEYLEARFGPSVRVICALIQVQYRTLVLGIIGMTIFLTMTIICEWPPGRAWGAVTGIAVVAAVYTAIGGLRSVAVTDALQFVVMTVAALVIWCVVFEKVGGLAGVERRLAEADPNLPAQMLHAGHDNIAKEDVSDLFTKYDEAEATRRVERKLLLGGHFDADHQVIIRRTPAGFFSLAMVIAGLAYSIVNHTQSMRMFASRNEWHLKMSAFAAGSVLIAMTFFNLTMGIMGRALHPLSEALPLEKNDSIYPYLVSQVNTIGLKGIVVAGIFAAALSTYDSIGSSLSALLTRDVYARLFVKQRDDRHYLRVGQWLTPVIIAISFLYLPFMEGGMVLFYLELTSTFVIPLLTLYLMGTFTRVHRRSGVVGLLAGAAYGVWRLAALFVADSYGIAIMPSILANTHAAYPISMAVTAGVMLLISLFVGWEKRGHFLHEEKAAWLRASQSKVQQLEDSRASHQAPHGLFARGLPALLVILAVVLGCYLSFVVFW